MRRARVSERFKFSPALREDIRERFAASNTEFGAQLNLDLSHYGYATKQPRGQTLNVQNENDDL